MSSSDARVNAEQARSPHSASAATSASSPSSPPHAAAEPTAARRPKAQHRPIPRTPQMVVKVRDCPSSHLPIELCYQCFGDPADGLPPVLLIGGLNMQLFAWDEEFCETLVRAGFYVIRYDNRDIGHSTKIEHRGRVKAPLLLLPGGAATWLGEKLPYGLEDMAADAWALLDALGIPCAHLFGISMGGMIAQTAALQAPERTISLTSVMSSTNAPDLPQPELWVKLWMLRRPPRNCTVEELLEFRVNSLRRLLRSALPPDGDFLKRRYLMSLKRSSYSAGLVRQAAAIRRAQGRDAALQKLLVPALVVHGAQDVVVPPMNGYRTATMLPYARMLVLKSMGHYFHPAFYSTIVEAFADMAASTDPARRGLGSRLPSASCLLLEDVPTPPPSPALPLPGPQEAKGKAATAVAPTVTGAGERAAVDGSASATAAWLRGGAVVNSPHSNKSLAAASTAAATPPPTATATTATVSATRPPDPLHQQRGSSAVREEGAAEKEEEEGAAVGTVDPRTLMMASIGAFIEPVVADAASPLGMAVCRSVMVAVPGGNSNPAVPEAVLVENMFLRTPHAVPSTATAAVVVKKPPVAATPSSSSTTPSASPTAKTAPQLMSSPLKEKAPVLRRSLTAGGAPGAAAASASAGGAVDASPSSSSAAAFSTALSTTSLSGTASAGPTSAGTGRGGVAPSSSSPSLTSAVPQPAPMDGAVRYVACSPSRWHEAAPFPQRSTKEASAQKAGGGAAAISGASAATATTTTTAAGGGGGSGQVRATASSSAPSFPAFRARVVGVPLDDYLLTHPMERETSGLAIVTNASLALQSQQRPQQPPSVLQRATDANPAAAAAPHAETERSAESSSTLMPLPVLVAANGDAVDIHNHQHQHQHPERSVGGASWVSATEMPPAASAVTGNHPEDSTRTLLATGAVRAAAEGGVGEGVDGVVVCEVPPSPSASALSQDERRENEFFLHSQAPSEIVEATALSSL